MSSQFEVRECQKSIREVTSSTFHFLVCLSVCLIPVGEASHENTNQNEAKKNVEELLLTAVHTSPFTLLPGRFVVGIQAVSMVP